MFLHNDKEAFGDLIVASASELGIETSIIEKDYYVSIILKKLNEKFDGIIFRGGTSLSKSYGVIERFSEDIDISVDKELGKMTEGRKHKLKQAVVDTIKEIGFEVYNLESTRSGRNFNQYIAKYDSIYKDVTLVKSELIIETYVATQPFPTMMRVVNNYIYQFLEMNNRLDLAELYDLAPFEMRVQDIRRTYIDKVFALCDYYMSAETAKHSRHIYDLYMLDSRQLYFTFYDIDYNA